MELVHGNGIRGLYEAGCALTRKTHPPRLPALGEVILRCINVKEDARDVCESRLKNIILFFFLSPLSACVHCEFDTTMLLRGHRGIDGERRVRRRRHTFKLLHDSFTWLTSRR